MKKSLLASCVAAAVSSIGGHAVAMQAAPTGGATTQVVVSGQNTGHNLVIPYYSAQGDNATLISLTNYDRIWEGVGRRAFALLGAWGNMPVTSIRPCVGRMP